jgi:hypothetical protein
MITGILSISNGVGLGYPFLQVATNLHDLCDSVIVGVDPTYPEDRGKLESLGLACLSVVDSLWDRSYKESGREIAVQMDKLVNIAKERGADWVVVLQADEFLHEEDFSILRMFMERSEDTTGFCLTRLYFWKSLELVRVDWNADLVRIFRPGHYSFLADGTDKAGMYSGQIVAGVEAKLPYYIYHYSRIGDPCEISQRLRNLDLFFHDDKDLVAKELLGPYDFKTRAYDNYSVDSPPPEVAGDVQRFNKTHPGIAGGYYGDK